MTKKAATKQPKTLPALIEDALAIEHDTAKDAGAMGFIARALTIATMPHKKVKESVFTRKNGLFTMTMLAPPQVGLPYGSYPRLLLSWLTTEAVRTKEREIVLGDSLSSFMRELDLNPTGGRWGTIPALKKQMKSLFCCSVSCFYEDKERAAMLGYQLVNRANLWWDPKNPEQASLWKSTVTLSEEFFSEIVDRPVPIDLRALKVLKRSPLALDIYCWLTYRVSYIKGPVSIPWVALQQQFGSQYAETAQGRRHFRAEFLKQLKKVLTVYSSVQVEADSKCFTIKGGRPHIARS